MLRAVLLILVSSLFVAQFVLPIAAQPLEDAFVAYREFQLAKQAEAEALESYHAARAALVAAQTLGEETAADDVEAATRLLEALARNTEAIEASFRRLDEASQPPLDILLEMDVLEAWYRVLEPAAAYLTEQSFLGAEQELAALAQSGLLPEGSWRFPTLRSVRDRLAELRAQLEDHAGTRERRKAEIRTELDELTTERDGIIAELETPATQAGADAGEDPWVQAALAFESAADTLEEARRDVRRAYDRLVAANANLRPPVLSAVSARSGGELLYEAQWSRPDGSSPDELERAQKRDALKAARENVDLALAEVRSLREAGNDVRHELAEHLALRGSQFNEWSQKYSDDLQFRAWANFGADIGLTVAEVVLTGGAATLARKSEELAMEAAKAAEQSGLRVLAAKDVRLAVSSEAEELLGVTGGLEKSLIERFTKEGEKITEGLRRASTTGVALLQEQMAARIDELVARGFSRSQAERAVRGAFQPAIDRLIAANSYTRHAAALAARNEVNSGLMGRLQLVSVPDREAIFEILVDKYGPKVPFAVQEVGEYLSRDPAAAIVAESDTMSDVLWGDAMETGIGLLISNYKATPAVAGAAALSRWARFKNAAYGTLSLGQGLRSIKANAGSLGVGLVSTAIKAWVAHQADLIVDKDAEVMAEYWGELTVLNAIYQREMVEDRRLAAIETDLEQDRAAIIVALNELDSGLTLRTAPLEPTSLWLPIEFDLTFSVELLAPPKVMVGGKMASVVPWGEHNTRYWKARLPLEDITPGLQVLTVSLDQQASPFGSLDANPVTAAAKEPGLPDWFGFETGEDQNHRFEAAVTKYEPVPPAYPVAAPEGNWLATYSDYPPGDTVTAHHAIHVPWTSTCTDNWKIGCIWRTVREEPPLLRSGDGLVGFSAGEQIVQRGNQVEFKWGYGHLGYWGSVGRLTIDQDRMTGRWQTRDGTEWGGSADWTRVTAKVTDVIIESEIESRGTTERPAEAKLTYSNGWGAGNDAPGNRPTFRVTLLGEQMWGHHVLEFRDVPGLQIRQVSAVTTGNDRTAESVTGITFRLMIWPGLSPGRKTLWFDGQPIAFDVRIENYP